MNVIILARDDASHVMPDQPGAYVIVGVDVVAGIERLRTRVTTATWRILRTDRWQYDARVVDELRRVDQLPGVELIDPTGLLGRSQYGSDRNAVGSNVAPLGRGAAGAVVRAKRRQTRNPAGDGDGDGDDRTWR